MRDTALPDVLVAGAGIGGLTTLLALHRYDIRARAVESVSDLRPVGLGINLLPHAVRELHRLELGEQLDRISMRPSSLAFHDSVGRLLFREDLGTAGGYGFPQCSVHRGDLQALLLHAVADRLGFDAVRISTRVTDFTDVKAGLVVTTSQGDMPADILVGADGIHSAVRAKLHPPAADPLLWSGVRMYRGLATNTPLLDGRTMVNVKAENGDELIVYPLTSGRTNWVLLVREASPGLPVERFRWDAPVDREQVAERVSNWQLGWLDPGALIADTETVLQFPMVDRQPLASWGNGKVTLLGDAAHPMYPVGANGASQSIVDAAILAECLAADPVGGLRNYETRRITATSAVVLANRERHADGAADLERTAARYRAQTGADMGGEI